ncbi:methyl-accepting chemotaxis protein [Salmonella enterica subsp. enterica serovar Richmond]|nr:methyl-accepting chemotaxis protein [Salmonella enterica subsp. enterica serovar Mikawasima]ECD3842772.1 methyl-accepting chemotaxis protein [Salmonella enterica subsp. enterica serovar Richmond]ECF2157567.1 methyl-accepting chemotaxis protein [Salmonella enterica subsp. enterica serovar Kottbus]ECF2559483.1 methyl-accepting chemotaxis protein [Salmonella enterica subsp. enterica serovar Ahuza]ECG4757172.1 methyl-accepting chemotaxis protein [Salmonella enterica subsp. enterica serovar Richm
MSSSKNIRLSSVSKPCAVYFRLPVAAGASGISVTNGAKVIHIRRLKSDLGVNLLS